jgi:hypothetical protein
MGNQTRRYACNTDEVKHTERLPAKPARRARRGQIGACDGPCGRDSGRSCAKQAAGEGVTGADTSPPVVSRGRPFNRTMPPSHQNLPTRIVIVDALASRVDDQGAGRAFGADVAYSSGERNRTVWPSL